MGDSSFKMGDILESLPSMTPAAPREDRMRDIGARATIEELLRAAARDEADASDRAAAVTVLHEAGVHRVEDLARVIDLVRACARAGRVLFSDGFTCAGGSVAH